MNRRSTGTLTCLGLGTLLAALALSGCSTTPSDSGDNNQGGNVPGGGGTTAAPGGGGTTAAPGTGGSTASGNAGTTASNAGAGSDVTATPGAGTGGAGGAGGAAGAAGAAGSVAAAGAGGASAGACDTSTFVADCKQGGAQWGTDQQSGPCKGGTTVYGVTSDFGPYGVASEYNVGADFNTGNTLASDFGICSVFIDSFGADPVGSADLKNTHDLDLGLFTVFYPGCMPDGEKFPLLTWANGTCAMPEGYGPLLRTVASYGYIVVAANSVQTGSGAQQRKAIDFMLAENDKMGSKFYQKIDADKIGGFGHSQGGMSTVAAADDARIKTVVIFNGGTSASKPYLAISGDNDISGAISGYVNAVMAAQRPAAYLWFHQIPLAANTSTTGALAPGHLTLMMEPERVQDATVAWFDMMLKQKPEAKAMFIGDSCTLCDGSAYPSMWAGGGLTAGSSMTPAIEYGHNSMLQ